MKKYKLKYLSDSLTLTLCIIGLLFEFCFTKGVSCLENILGGIGIIYCAYYIIIAIFYPIKRDWILVKGHFLIKIVNFVLLVPFVIVGVLHIVDKHSNLSSKVLPKVIVYDENLYTYEGCEYDTIEIITSGKGTANKFMHNRDTVLVDEMLGFGDDSLMVKVAFQVQDSLLVENHGGSVNSAAYLRNNLPDSISRAQEDPSLFWTVYYHFIDPGNQHMTTSKLGRIIAAATAISGFILLNGLLISTLISWFDRRRELWNKGEIRYKSWVWRRRKFAVVIGANESAPTIIKQLFEGHGEAKVKYVLLLTNEDAGLVREKISSYLDDVYSRRLVVYNGQLDSVEEIYKLNIEKATEIYVLGELSHEDDSESYHDIQNMRCVHNLASYLTEKCTEKRIICRVQFEYQTTFSVFQFSDLPSRITEHLVFIPFNSYENWAQQVFVAGRYDEMTTKVLPRQRRIDIQDSWMNRNVIYPIFSGFQAYLPKNNIETRQFKYLPLEGEKGIKADSKKTVHLVVVGMSKMGIAMALQAAQIAHYPNFKPGKEGYRTRITFIDANADKEKEFFMGRFQNMFALTRHRTINFEKGDTLYKEWEDPVENINSEYRHLCLIKDKNKNQEKPDFMGNFIDLEWEFINGNVEQQSVKDYLVMSANKAKDEETGTTFTIAICFPLAHEAIAAALYMPIEVYEYAQQILVYQREASDMIFNFVNANDVSKRYTKIVPFGMQNADFTCNKTNYYRAQLANYVYSLIFDKSVCNERINERIAGIGNVLDKGKMQDVRREWKRLSMANRWSNKYLANSFGTKLKSLGMPTTNISANLTTICQNMADPKNEMDMAICEHNRWNVQQLLMGFRAYKESEAKEYQDLMKKKEQSVADAERFKNHKEKMKKGFEKVHLNICSFEKLKEVDKEAADYDKILNSAVPYIMSLVETSKVDCKKKK